MQDNYGKKDVGHPRGPIFVYVYNEFSPVLIFYFELVS